jgi:PhnB protein
LLYQDAGAAVTWLERAFGLRRTGDLYKGEDGRVTHASLTLGEAQVMLGSPGPDFKNPKIVGHATQNVYVDVDDVAKHYARAVRAGATIIEEPKDTPYGARRYGADDPEGHRWYFAQDLSVKPARKRARAKVRSRRTKRRVGKRSARK